MRTQAAPGPRGRRRRIPLPGRALGVVVAALLVACGGGSPGESTATATGSAAGSTESASGSPTAADTMPVGDAGSGSAAAAAVTEDAATAQVPALDLGTRASSLAAWQRHYLPARVAALDWSGNVANCVVGGTGAVWRHSVLRQVNFARAAAGLPGTVLDDAALSAQAQAAALMMDANDDLSHSPPTTWRCYSAEGAAAAGRSNLAYGTALARAGAAGAIDLYLSDADTPSLGHRRWLLFPPQTTMGTGDTPQANALWVILPATSAVSASLAPEGVAWPPRGWWPRALVDAGMAWSYGLAGADFSAATVTVTDSAGQPVALTQWVTPAGYGDNTLAFRPASGSWSVGGTADQPFDVAISGVRVGGVARSVSYRVTLFSPS